MEKIKVLQFPISSSKGGITQYALRNWKKMDKEKFHCDFATMSKNIEFEKELQTTGSELFYISCYAEENRQQFEYEFDKLLSRGYDVVHLHTKQWKSFLVEEICRRHNIPKVIVHAHATGIDNADEVKRIKEKQLHEQVKSRFSVDLATHFLACSSEAANFLFSERIPRDRIRIMHNAIELNRFSYNKSIRNEYRGKYGLENCFVIGHVGRFAYQKNHEFLIDIFKIISKKIDRARLLLLGDGELFAKVQRQVENLNLKDKVYFLGNTDNVENWYQVMDVFCLPSRFEGLGMVLIEAQAAGLKCIASENVPREANITGNITYLPLAESEWVDEIMNYSGGYLRKSSDKNISKAGYDINEEIKVLQSIYEE